ncbi:hypothetical protein Q8A67_025775 [Cirrhinus molitorella]|uniref:Uncharacterized protein n=1 Tax=Cirrhinus molitorella TaxID=172907 RepID=A0AA88T9Z8_9TELE|nr:hypothetical protein Q8A67_025775 [Cirrhinus molitorella]
MCDECLLESSNSRIRIRGFDGRRANRYCSEMSLKSRLDISEELVEQLLEMTDIQLPQCERSRRRNNALGSRLITAPAVSRQPSGICPAGGGADERLWPRVVQINPQLGFGYRRAPAEEWIRGTIDEVPAFKSFSTFMNILRHYVKWSRAADADLLDDKISCSALLAASFQQTVPSLQLSGRAVKEQISLKELGVVSNATPSLPLTVTEPVRKKQRGSSPRMPRPRHRERVRPSSSRALTSVPRLMRVTWFLSVEARMRRLMTACHWLLEGEEQLQRANRRRTEAVNHGIEHQRTDRRSNIPVLFRRWHLLSSTKKSAYDSSHLSLKSNSFLKMLL